MNSIKFLTLTLLLAFSFAASSKAEIELVNASAGGSGDQTVPFTEGSIELPGGPGQSFELLVCATSSLGTNSFLAPSPGSFSPLDLGGCGNADIPIGSCISGIWTNGEPGSSARDGLCSWTDPATVYAAGVFRWTGVDTDNPIIDIECNTGFGAVATSPSINVDEGSGIVRIFTFGVNFDPQIMNANEILSGSIFVFALSENPGNLQGVFLREIASIAEESGPTDPFEINLATEIGQQDAQAPWRACTVGIRRNTFGPTPIPTMSEWGMGIFVVLTAAASIYAIRRRTRTA